MEEILQKLHDSGVKVPLRCRECGENFSKTGEFQPLATPRYAYLCKSGHNLWLSEEDYHQRLRWQDETTLGLIQPQGDELSQQTVNIYSQQPDIEALSAAHHNLSKSVVLLRTSSEAHNDTIKAIRALSNLITEWASRTAKPTATPEGNNG